MSTLKASGFIPHSSIGKAIGNSEKVNPGEANLLREVFKMHSG